jgi:uncharacterized membrane protein
VTPTAYKVLAWIVLVLAGLFLAMTVRDMSYAYRADAIFDEVRGCEVSFRGMVMKSVGILLILLGIACLLYAQTYAVPSLPPGAPAGDARPADRFQ